jgi:hypothetical protein
MKKSLHTLHSCCLAELISRKTYFGEKKNDYWLGFWVGFCFELWYKFFSCKPKVVES